MTNFASYPKVAIAFWLAAASTFTCAADFPSRPIRIVVPSTPGGVLDVLARLVSPKLTMKWGQPIVIDNRAGADGIIGTDIVAKSAPDGYTLLFAAPSFSINPALYKLPYDTVNDFTVITIIGSTPNVLVAHPSLPARTIRELINLAKQSPGKINYASSGVGSGGHLAMELFKRMAGIDLTHVPYKGAGAAALGVVSGQSQLFATAPGTVISQIKANQLRALAVTSPGRSTALPEVPTFAESGFNGYAVVNSLTIAGPGKMPKPLVNNIYGALVELLKMPDISSQINAMAIDVSGITPEKAGEYITAQVKMWEGVMKAANIRRPE